MVNDLINLAYVMKPPLKKKRKGGMFRELPGQGTRILSRAVKVGPKLHKDSGSTCVSPQLAVDLCPLTSFVINLQSTE